MVSAIDLEARKKAAELMRKIFMNIVSEIEREGRPVLVLPKRTLSNTIYDYKTSSSCLALRHRREASWMSMKQGSSCKRFLWPR